MNAKTQGARLWRFIVIVVVTLSAVVVALSFTPLMRATNCGGYSAALLLTTACVDARWLDDNCHKLRSFRRLRDDHLSHTVAGRQLIGNYYQTAPDIVSTIHRESNSQEVLDEIYDALIRPCVSLIDSDRFEDAVKYYSDGVAAMERRLFQSTKRRRTMAQLDNVRGARCRRNDHWQSEHHPLCSCYAPPLPCHSLNA